MRARRVQKQGRRLGREAAAGRPGRSCRTSCARSAGFRVEVDAMPGGFVCSGVDEGRRSAGRCARGRRRGRAVRKLFSKEQRAFFAEHAPEGIEPRRPVAARPDLRAQARSRRRTRPAARGGDVALPRRLAHSRALDQVPAGGGLPGRRGDAGVPRRSGFDLGGEQETKTRKALEFFSKQLKATAAAPKTG